MSLPKSPPDGWVTERGWYDMSCFNALSGDLQRRLVYYGNLPIGYSRTQGRCDNPAEVEVTTVWDDMPGPRFYCLACAAEYLSNLYFMILNRGEAEIDVTPPSPDTEV